MREQREATGEEGGVRRGGGRQQRARADEASREAKPTRSVPCHATLITVQQQQCSTFAASLYVSWFYSRFACCLLYFFFHFFPRHSSRAPLCHATHCSDALLCLAQPLSASNRTLASPPSPNGGPIQRRNGNNEFAVIRPAFKIPNPTEQVPQYRQQADPFSMDGGLGVTVLC